VIEKGKATDKAEDSKHRAGDRAAGGSACCVRRSVDRPAPGFACRVDEAWWVANGGPIEFIMNTKEESVTEIDPVVHLSREKAGVQWHLGGTNMIRWTVLPPIGCERMAGTKSTSRGGWDLRFAYMAVREMGKEAPLGIETLSNTDTTTHIVCIVPGW